MSDAALPQTAAPPHSGGGKPGGTLAAQVTAARPVLPVLLYILAVLTPVFFHAGPIMLSFLRLFLLVMTVPLAINLLSGRYGKLVVTDYLFFAHVLWMVVAFAVTMPDRIIENIGSTALEFLGGYLVGRAYIRSKADFVTLTKWLAYAIIAMLPLALYEARTGDIIVARIINSLPGLTSHFPHGNEPRLGLNRVQGLLAHPIHHGLFCSMGFALCFIGLKGIVSHMQRYVLSALVFGVSFLGLSAGSILALVLQVGLIIWFAVLHKYSWKWKLLFVCGLIAYIVVDILSNRSPVEVFISYATFSPHTGYWRLIIFEWGMMNIFGDEERNIPPAVMFGIGLADWVRPWFMYSGSMDNFWLVIGIRYGVPGFLLLAAGYLITIVKVARRDFTGDVQLENMRRAWVFTFAGLTLTLFTVHVWTSLYSFVFFVFGAGIWMLTAQIERPEDAQAEAEGEGTPAQDGTRSHYSRFPQTGGRATPPAPLARQRP